MTIRKLSTLLAALLATTAACTEDSSERAGAPSRQGPESHSTLVHIPSVSTSQNDTFRFWTGIQVHNLAPADASVGSIRVKVHFYGPDGSYVGSEDKDIARASSETFLASSTVPANWKGSAVVEAPEGEAIAAAVNLLHVEQSGSGDQLIVDDRADTYEGVSAPSTEVFVPVIDLRGQSELAVQNTTGDVASVTVEYIGDTGSTFAQETVISADGVLFLRPDNLASRLDSAGAGGRPIVSARITSTRPVAVATSSHSHATISAYTGQARGANLVPLVNFQSPVGIDTWVYAQNTDASSATLTANYTSNDGRSCTETVSGVSPYATVDFGWSFMGRTANSTAGLSRSSTCHQDGGPVRFVGSASLSSSSGASNVVVAAVQKTDENGAFVEAAFSGQHSSGPTRELVFPLLMANHHNWLTGVSIVNNSSEAASVTCKFSDTTGMERAREDFSVCPNASYVVLQSHQFVDGFVGSAVCTADRGSIRGIANGLLGKHVNSTDGKPWNAFSAYNGTARAGTAAGSSTPHIDRVTDDLCDAVPHTEYRAWERSYGNTLVGGSSSGTGHADDWLLHSPDCWGNQGGCTDAPGARRLLETIENDIAAATQWVDISTLAPFPTGAFHDAIVDGLRTAFENNPNLTVRILGGLVPGLGDAPGQACVDGLLDNPQCYYEKIRADLHIPDTAKLTVTGFESQIGFSWNHSKIIAVDGVSAIVGGHNLQEGTYGGGGTAVVDPVADVTMRLEGPAAKSAHRYLDQLWTFACDPNLPNRATIDTPMASSAGAQNTCPSRAPVSSGTPGKGVSAAAPGAGDVAVLGVGGFGLGMDPNAWAHTEAVDEDANASCTDTGVDYFNGDDSYDLANPDNIALRSLIESAKERVFLYQQDMMGVCVPLFGNARYDLELFDVLAGKLADGVKLQIVLSSPDAKQGSLAFPYSNSSSLTDVTDALTDRLDALGGLGGRSARDVICQNLQLSSMQHAAGEGVWANGHSIANHSKVVVSDGEAFFVGSKNLYPTTLQDYGFVVEDPEGASILEQEYRTQAWAHSADAAIVDYSTGRCDI